MSFQSYAGRTISRAALPSSWFIMLLRRHFAWPQMQLISCKISHFCIPNTRPIRMRDTEILNTWAWNSTIEPMSTGWRNATSWMIVGSTTSPTQSGSVLSHHNLEHSFAYNRTANKPALTSPEKMRKAELSKKFHLSLAFKIFNSSTAVGHLDPLPAGAMVIVDLRPLCKRIHLLCLCEHTGKWPRQNARALQLLGSCESLMSMTERCQHSSSHCWHTKDGSIQPQSINFVCYQQ